MGLVELVDLIRRLEVVVMGDFSSISRVGEGTGDSSGSGLGLGCSDRARTLSLTLAGHIVTQQGEIGPALHSCAVQCCHLTPAPAQCKLHSIYLWQSRNFLHQADLDNIY